VSYQDGVRLDTGEADYTCDVRAAMSVEGEFVVSWLELRGQGESLVVSPVASPAPATVTKERMIISHNLVPLGDGSMLLLWAGQHDAGWPVRAKVVGFRRAQSNRADGGAEAKLLTVPEVRAHNIAVAPDPRGGVVAAWEEHPRRSEGGVAEPTRIALRRFADGAWGEVVYLAAADASFYDPSIGFGRAGLVLGVTACRDGNFTVELRTLATGGNSFGEAIPVSDSVHHAVRPSLAASLSGDVWVAFVTYDGPKRGTGAVPHFVRHDRRLRQLEFWRYARDIRAACWDGERITWPLVGGNFRPPVLPATRHPNFPKMLFDTNSKPWVAYQVHQELEVFNNKAQAELMYFDGNAWSRPIQNNAPHCLGECGPVAAAVDPAGRLWLAWQGETRLEGELSGAREGRQCPGIFARTVRVGSYPWGETRTAAMARNPYRKPATDNPLCKGSIEVAGKAHRLLFGNLHRHTHVSVCGRFANGDFDLHYRHSRDVMHADFCAITDHCFNNDLGHWMGNYKHANFYSIPGVFISPPAIEWTDVSVQSGGVGHLNVYHFDNAFAPLPQTPNNNPRESYETLQKRYKGRKVLAIPHHMPTPGFESDMGRMDLGGEVSKRDPWRLEPRFVPVVEIFQDMRGTCEAPGAPGQNYAPGTLNEKAYALYHLLRGKVFGFICSSDHSGVAQAGLYVAEPTLDGMYEAIRRRRTIGTTGAQVFVDFRVDGNFIGSAVPLGEGDEAKAITVGMKAAVAIRTVELLGQGQVVACWHPGGEQFEMEHADADWRDRLRQNAVEGFPANLFYYLRITLDDGEMAWTSPVFFVAGSR